MVLTKLAPLPAWWGIVAENDYMILGIGGAFYGDDGKWWAFFRRMPGVKNTLTAHKAAKITLKVAGDMGIALHAIADEEITGSVEWLSRLGFRATEEIFLGRVVWRWVQN